MTITKGQIRERIEAGAANSLPIAHLLMAGLGPDDLAEVLEFFGVRVMEDGSTLVIPARPSSTTADIKAIRAVRQATGLDVRQAVQVVRQAKPLPVTAEQRVELEVALDALGVAYRFEGVDGGVKTSGSAPNCPACGKRMRITNPLRAECPCGKVMTGVARG